MKYLPPKSSIIQQIIGSMQFDDDRSIEDEDNLEDILEDLDVDDQISCNFTKKDNTIFVVDCSPEIMAPLPSQKVSEFDQIMDCYANFMMTKVIANCSDRAGLILYNVGRKSNSLNFDNITTVHALDPPSAKMIKSVSNIKNDFPSLYGYSSSRVSLHQVLWLYGQEIKDTDPVKNHFRLFLFTSDDCPYSEGDERREQAINHARQLAAKGVCIQLFPIRGNSSNKFDVRKFFQEIISFDVEDLNPNTLDCSSKIMDLQSRIRQKEYKKRTQYRLLMQIGIETEVAVKVFSLFSKAKKPQCKKLEASTNRPLKRVTKRLNRKGEALFDEQLGLYYPLGGERIPFTKEEVAKIKGIKKKGITLIGFKPAKLIKPYHSLRSSQFLYPDEEHVSGSTQFIDALIDTMIEKQQVAIISIMPRSNQQLRFAALFPQKQSYDAQNHQQRPPGLHMITLPYSDDIVNYNSSQKTNIKPGSVSIELVKLTKLLINNLTVEDFDLRDFQNSSLQKFYSHLQAHALNEKVVEEKEDTMQPDYEGMQKYSDVIRLLAETAGLQVKQEWPEQNRERPSRSAAKKEEKIQKLEGLTNPKKTRVNNANRKEIQPPTPNNNKEVKMENLNLLTKVQSFIEDGLAMKLKAQQLSMYLKLKGLNCRGQKAELADRIMLYISFLNDTR